MVGGSANAAEGRSSLVDDGSFFLDTNVNKEVVLVNSKQRFTQKPIKGKAQSYNQSNLTSTVASSRACRSTCATVTPGVRLYGGYIIRSTTSRSNTINLLIAFPRFPSGIVRVHWIFWSKITRFRFSEELSLMG